MSYEIRFSALAIARYRESASAPIRRGVRMLAARAEIHAPALLARSTTGALADPGRLADGVAIKFVRDVDGCWFLVRAGHQLAACDVLPEQRVVLVLTIVGRYELMAGLGLSSVPARAVPIGLDGWRG